MNETELLFTGLLDCTRHELYLGANRMLSPVESSLIKDAFIRRISGEPPEYILGKTEFMGLEFLLSKDVLIPRPETEILVQEALKYAGDPGGSILDMCTGSGCIAVSLAKLLKGVQVEASDISEAALSLARRNALAHAVEVNFIAADLFSGGYFSGKKYSLIVCNPPYVKRRDLAGLAAEVKCQPVLALDGGEDGLDFYRRLINEAHVYLRPEGVMLLEIGFGQRRGIEKIVSLSLELNIIDIKKDYSGIERVIALSPA